VKFAFIDAKKAAYPISALCRCLRVSRSGFYASRERPASTHAEVDRRLRVAVRASFDASRRRYGSPRVHADLADQNVQVSRKRVARIMREEGLKARPRKRFKCTTMSDHDQPVAANLLNRDFTAAAPNQRWVGDTSEFLAGDGGKLYLAVILRPVLAVRGRLGRERGERPTSDDESPRDGDQTALSPGGAAASFGSRLDVRERGLPDDPRDVRYHLQHESPRRLL
jgi:hypothetical protein